MAKRCVFLLDIPHEGEYRRLGGDADLPSVAVHKGTGAVAVVLHHAEGWYGQPGPCHGLQRAFTWPAPPSMNSTSAAG
jgi:hypothetical protein